MLDARSGKVGWNATDRTPLVCSIIATRVGGFCASVQFHNLTVLSSEPDARSGKIEWKATDVTESVCFKVVIRVGGFCTFEQFHNLMVLS